MKGVHEIAKSSSSRDGSRGKRNGSLARRVRDAEKNRSEGALAPAVFLISHELRQPVACWERVSVEERESQRSQVRATFMFITAGQKECHLLRQVERSKRASNESFGATGFVTDPFQQGWYRIGADGLNRCLSLAKLLRGWTFAVISWSPYPMFPAVSAYVQPLLKSPTVINRLVIGR